jgi:RNA polymerase sigma factor (sigma-70 family)
MILRVCQRTLGDRHDAEDALQATFLVLARQAAAIRKTSSLAGWLHGVAYRTALHARRAACRRQKHEARATSRPPSDPALSAAWRELAALLDAEIERLPEALRTPFTLCCLENRTYAEAASLLGIGEGAVAMRLSRARQRLRQRLERRGVALSAVLAVSALGASDAAALPAPLVAGVALAAARIVTGKAITAELISTTALQLAEGVLKTMVLNQLKTGGTVVLLASLVLAGVLALGLQALPQTAEATPPAPESGIGMAVQAGRLVAGQAEPEPGPTYLDLQPKANQKLKETFIPANYPDNDLAGLKQGKQTLEGLKFNIGEGLIRLANDKLKDKLPEKVEGIKVGAKFARLHILHATAYRDAADTVIARYVVHYADKTDETIEVVYGQDVLDWWNYPGTPQPGRGKVVWTGENEAAKGFKANLWLFAQTWQNPHPNKQVTSIDYVSTLTDAAPFVVAMTVEGPSLKDVGVGKDGARFIRAGKWVQSLAYCQGGKNLAVVLWNGAPRAESRAGSVVLWDVSKSQLHDTLEKFDNDLEYWSVAASRQGTIVAASATHAEKADYGAIRVWDAGAGKVLRTFEFPAQVHAALALSPDGKKVAGGDCFTADGAVRVWDVPSGELLKKLHVPDMEYFAVALSDDGKWIAGGGRARGGRGKVIVWDLESGKVKHEWTDDFMLAIAALAFSPDGKLLAGGGPNNRATWVWDMESGKVKHVLKDHEVKKLAFAPDGQTLATGGADHQVILWDVAKEKPRVTFEPSMTGDQRQVITHVFSPDGRTLAAGCADGTIRFWPVPR